MYLICCSLAKLSALRETLTKEDNELKELNEQTPDLHDCVIQEGIVYSDLDISKREKEANAPYPIKEGTTLY